MDSVQRFAFVLRGFTAWLLEGLALTLFLPPSWEELLESLAKDFQILLWNSRDDGSSVLGGGSHLAVPCLV